MESPAPTQKALARDLGLTLARLRKAAGWTQEQLAERAGLDVQAVQRAETGRTVPSLERLGRLATALGTGLTGLFAAADSEPAVMPPLADRLTADERVLLEVYRSLPAPHRRFAVPVLRGLGPIRPTDNR
jgi:transcriptional regulator with XRE-family HTH domain